MSKKWAIVVGSSTGGTQILDFVLEVLPRDFPHHMFIVQHIPPKFVEHLCRRLDKLCKLQVQVGEEGKFVKPGQVHVAPGEYHLMLRNANPGESPGKYIYLSDERHEYNICPAIDFTMQSAAEAYRKYTLGVVLSGMGDDGVVGAQAIKEAGGKVIVQDPNECIIRSMPQSIIEAGHADQVVHPQQLGQTILDIVSN